MALISVDYFSSSLMRTTTLEVILPVDDQGAAYATDSVMRHAGGSLEDEMRAWEQSPYPPKKAPFRLRRSSCCTASRATMRTGSARPASAAGPRTTGSPWSCPPATTRST